MPWDPIIYKLQYTLLTLLASLFWLIDRAILFVTLMVYSVKSFIINTTSGDGGFVLQTVNNLLTGNEALQNLVILAAGLALLAFSLSRILRPILELNPVDPGRVLLWLAVFAMLLTLGSSFFLDLEQGRDQIRQIASQAVIGANSSSGNFTPAGIPQHLPNQMRQPRHFPFIGGSGCAVPPCSDGDASNGLDLALAFLFVSAEDEISTMSGGDPQHQYMPIAFTQRSAAYNPSEPPPNPAPEDGYGGYFYWDTAHTDLANNDQRQAAVDRAVQGVVRMMAAVPVCLFALLEALIYLALTIAAAVLFISVPLAMIFAFFRSTEVVMVGLVRSYVALYAKTFAVTSMLTLFFSFLLWFANAGNWGAFMAICIVMLLFSFQFLGLAFGTVRGSLDTLTGSISTALGSPASARQGLSEARSIAATGLAAAGQGASLAGSAGSMLGRVALGAAGGPLGLAVGAAGLLGGRVTAARLSGLTSGRMTGRSAAGSSGGSSRARANSTSVRTAGSRPQNGAAGHGASSSERSGALGRIGAADGTLVRDGRAGRRVGAAIGRTLAHAGDRAAVQGELAHTDLAVADRSALADLVANQPQEVGVVMGAVEETLQQQPDLTYLAQGRLDPQSPGLLAVLDKLQGRLPAEDIARLRDDAAGKHEMRLLLGSRLGVERKFGQSELQRGIAVAAGSGAGIDELTAGLGVAPHAFGASHAAVDHFVRELHALGLTGEDDVRNALILARDVKRQSPTGDFSQASRARAVKGKVPALRHFERKLGLAAERAALAAGHTDPREAELRIGHLLRDALEVPTSLYAQVVPPVMDAASAMEADTPTTVMTPAAETQPLEVSAAPWTGSSEPTYPAASPLRRRESRRSGTPVTVRSAEEDSASSAASSSWPQPAAAAALNGANGSLVSGAPTPNPVASTATGMKRRKNASRSRQRGRSHPSGGDVPQLAPLMAEDFPEIDPGGDRASTASPAEWSTFEAEELGTADAASSLTVEPAAAVEPEVVETRKEQAE